MSQWWGRYCDAIDQRNERERVLITLSALLVLVMLFITLVSDPLSASKRSVLASQQQLQQEMASLQAEIDSTHAEAQALRQAVGGGRIEELHKSIAHFDRVLRDATVNLITPQQMSELLQVMLQRQKGLSLIGVESYSEPLTLSDTDQGSAEVVKGDSESKSRAPDFYRHGMRLEMEGDFFAVQAYLKSVEESRWSLFWEGLEYEVVKPPKARVRLNIFTLSRDPEWLGMGGSQG
ncbi:hypothetical protein [Aestuariirhabdus sp. LZHN29]|uniref:hypothetical protein n=1 Tax=Aestuariirhabdus sp. LZHN29 TaxID=3417462 RepID=UPI003CEE492F